MSKKYSLLLITLVTLKDDKLGSYDDIYKTPETKQALIFVTAYRNDSCKAKSVKSMST